MAKIGVWRTFSGAAFLTYDAVGFGFYGDHELAKLQSELEMGKGANQAAGFSGSVYPLDRLRKVEINEPRKRVVIVFRDLLLSDKDDFNFTTLGGCREFCDCLQENLGPGWVRGPVVRRRFLLIVVAVLLALGLLLMLAVSISAVLAGPDPVVRADGTVTTQAESIRGGLMSGGISIAGLVATVGWLWFMIKRPRRVDTIYKP